MSHTNPFWLGAVCVVLGALLWMVPSCWPPERSEASPPAEVPQVTRTYASAGWGPVSVLAPRK